MRVKRFLFISIILIYCLVSILYSALTPPWESPDEPAHYLYISELAAHWRPPQKSLIHQTTRFYKDQAFTTSNYEWYQPALGYLPGALVYKGIATFAPQSLPGQMPLLSSLFPSIPARYNVFIHPQGGVFRVWQDMQGLLLLRILLSLLGLPVILAAFKLGDLMDKEHGFLGIAAAGWVAFLPQFTYINASVRSDTLTNALAALVILVAAWMLTSKTNVQKKALLMGILLGFGLISKSTFIYMVPIGFMAVILSDLRSPRSWLRPAILILAPVLIICGGYYLVFNEARVALTYSFTTVLKINPALLTWKHLQEIPKPLLIDLFYARFGWANVATPAIFSWIAFGFWIAGVCITVFQVFRLRHKPELNQQLRIVMLLMVGLILALIAVVRFNLAVVQPQGRFLFPALLPWAVLGFWGTWQYLNERGEKIAALLSISSMLLFNVYALFFVLIPAYWG